MIVRLGRSPVRSSIQRSCNQNLSQIIFRVYSNLHRPRYSAKIYCSGQEADMQDFITFLDGSLDALDGKHPPPALTLSSNMPLYHFGLCQPDLPLPQLDQIDDAWLEHERRHFAPVADPVFFVV